MLGEHDKAIVIDLGSLFYECAPNFHELGAGFAFTGVATECMSRLSPAVTKAMDSAGVLNKTSFDNYWDGYHSRHPTNANGVGEHKTEDTIGDPDGTAFELFFNRSNHHLGFQGCLRAQFLGHLATTLPPGVTHFNKKLVSYSDPRSSSSDSVTLRFTDGTTSTADTLVGCDGLHNRVRAQLLTVDAALSPKC